MALVVSKQRSPVVVGPEPPGLIEGVKSESGGLCGSEVVAVVQPSTSGIATMRGGPAS
jgi:hypothetical protein